MYPLSVLWVANETPLENNSEVLKLYENGFLVFIVTSHFLKIN